MRALLIIIIIAVIVAGGYLWLHKSNQGLSITPNPTESSTPINGTASPEVSTTVSPNTGTSVRPTPTPEVSTVKSFTIMGGEYYFNPNQITVNKGDTVKITFQNEGGNHNLVIDQFNVRTPTIQSNQSATIQFVADKAGSFEYYCSIGSHRALGMHGTLVVK